MYQLDKKRLYEDLGRYFPVFDWALTSAIARVNEKRIGSLYCRRTVCGMVRDEAVELLKRELHDWSTTTINGQLFFTQDPYLVRVKRLNHELKSQNHRSHQNDRLRCQLPIGGLPNPIYLDVGYIPSSCQSYAISTHITRPGPNGPLLHLPLVDPAAALSNADLFPEVDVEYTHNVDGVTIRPRRHADNQGHLNEHDSGEQDTGKQGDAER